MSVRGTRKRVDLTGIKSGEVLTFWVVWPMTAGDFFSVTFSFSFASTIPVPDRQSCAGGESDEKQNKSTEMLLLEASGMDCPKKIQSADWPTYKCISGRETVLGSAKRQALGLVNFVPALPYHFCLSLPAAFTQPRDHRLAEPCTRILYCLSAPCRA